MPPKKGTKAQKAAAAPPLAACAIAISGTFPGHTHSSLEKEYITALGATLAKTVTASTTHLVATDSDFAKPSAKVKQARTHHVPIVKLAWLEECLEKSAKLSEDDYTFDDNANDSGSRKRAAGASDDSEDEPQPKKKAKAKPKTTNGSASQSQPASQPASKPASTNGIKQGSKAGPSPKPKAKPEVVEATNNITKSSDLLNIPVDEGCPWGNYQVYIDRSGLIFDASLNQTNASNNNNKFYRLQVLRGLNGDYKTWSRWGRVGDRGQSATLGDGSLDDALRQFDSKFKGKTGLAWENRGNNPKPNKYTFVERSYAPDSDGDDDDAEPEVSNVKTEEKSEAPESKLHPAIQDLMELVFNQQYFAAAMTDFNYDVKKLPLGKLSKNTILRGYQALKDLSALIDDPSLAQSEYGTSYQNATEQLSNSFYSLIPHAFGRNRPPIIRNQDMLDKEVQLLDSLGDMKDAANIMKKEPKEPKDVERINVLDRQFQGLNLDEMTPLKKGSTEYTELQNYLVDTRAETHDANYQVAQIFRISRQDEKDRFNDNSPFAGPPRDRRLLWHGSRCTNFGGILSQGLRIAPPEAPVSGYMFGKGIYLADMSSKSANYCCSYISGGHALLLLCEAELGDPMLTLTNASYNADSEAKSKGMFSTWGQGTTGPKLWKDAECIHPSLKGVKLPDTSAKPGSTGVNNAYLLYNEYITYDISQVRLRYLFRVKM